MTITTQAREQLIAAIATLDNCDQERALTVEEHKAIRAAMVYSLERHEDILTHVVMAIRALQRAGI